MRTKLLLFAFLFICFKNTVAQPTIQWQKSFGGTQDDYTNAIEQTTDGGYIIAGASFSVDGDATVNHGDFDYWIVKLNSSGGIQWQKSLGGTGNDRATAIQQTTDSGYIVAGYSYSIDGDVTGHHGINGVYDYWIVKLNNAGAIQWQKAYGGTGDDYAYAIQQTNDGGYIVAGYSASNDGDVSGHHGYLSYFDYWIVKLESNGTIQWQKSLGGTGDNDKAYSVKQTIDGGYIVAGWSNSTDGDVTGNHGGNGYCDYWIVKLDNSGNIQWQKSLGGTGQDYAYAVQQATDGGYIVTGESVSTDGDVTGRHGSSYNYDYWIVKLNNTGSIQWQKCLGGTYDDRANAIQQTTEGGYIIVGYSYSIDGDVTSEHGSSDYWLVKLDSTGFLQWQKALGGTKYDWANAIQQTTEGGYIVAGYSQSNDGDVTGNHGGYDYWIVKLSPYVAIDEPSVNKNSFSVFPNPSNEKFTLSFNKPVQNASLKIFNTLGEEIYSEPITSAITRKEIELNAQPGIYFLQVQDNQEQYTRKIIVE